MQCETLNERQSQAKTKLMDLQCRSILYSQVFLKKKQTVRNCQREGYVWESVEYTLHCLFKNEMNINTYLPFDRANRLGARRAGQTFR